MWKNDFISLTFFMIFNIRSSKLQIFEVTFCFCLSNTINKKSKISKRYFRITSNLIATKFLHTGLSDLPVMCTTIERIDTDDCDWYSCGEWCLSKSSHCTKIWAQVRKNGTDVLFKGCSNIEDITCQVRT